MSQVVSYAQVIDIAAPCQNHVTLNSNIYCAFSIQINRTTMRQLVE